MAERVDDNDNPGVLVHPPFFFLGALIIGTGLGRISPAPIFSLTYPRFIGGIVACLGLALIMVGRRCLIAHATNVNPTLPTKTIVCSGPYRFTRNPLYLGLTIIYFGLTLVLNTWWPLLFLFPVLLIMHFGVVRREERYLERKFGDSYRDYCARVRRYF